MFRSVLMVVGIFGMMLASATLSARRASAQGQGQGAVYGERLAVNSTVCTLPDSLNVRLSPGYRWKSPGDIVAELGRGTDLTLLGGPEYHDGLMWWYASAGPWTRGWVAEYAESGARLLGTGRACDVGFPPTSASSTLTIGGVYVREGDTLGRLANRHGTTVVDLMRANGLVDSRLSIGQFLWLGGNSTRFGESRILGDVIAADAFRGRLEILRAESTAMTVSAHYATVEHGAGGMSSHQALVPGTTVEVFGTYWGAELVADRIYVIDRRPLTFGPIARPASLSAPSSPQSGRWHTVSPGETLFSLARHYATTIEAIQRVNGMAPGTFGIQAYDTIRIP